MKTVTKLLAALLLTLVSGIATYALPLQTYVSSTGNDTNDCTQSTPCRTFAGAAAKTAAKGSITALDSSTYGLITIDKALTIQAAPGVYAALEGGRNTDAITINAAPTDVVVLRNLQIITRSVADTNGIVINTVGTLHVESSVITGFKAAGISGPSLCNENGCAQLYVIDTILRDNDTGIKIGNVNASIDHCRIENNKTGAQISMQAKVTISNCLVAGNINVGLDATPLGNGRVETCIVTNNGTGIRSASAGSGSDAVYVVSNSMISGNHTGVAVNGGKIFSFGNNRFSANGVNGAFTDTLLQQ